MKILAIETSCDETAIAILDISGALERPEIQVLGNSLMSQAHLHEEYGGVYPNLAKREHQKNLPILLEQVIDEASQNSRNSEIVGAPAERVKSDAISTVEASIDLIAVTQGPGLEPALWTGITFAQELGTRWDKPVIGVDHMTGHIYSVLSGTAPDIQLNFPALALLVSGGHTELVLIQDFNSYEILGKTRDDAVGEAFDKVARMLGLSYPGGPKVSRLAQEAREQGVTPEFTFPRPMINSKDLDFSFSGLKTAVLYKLKAEGREDEQFKQEVALAFEDAVIDTLIHKTAQALDQYPEVRTLIIGGGVSANTTLITRLHEMSQEYSDIKLLVPSRDMSTDNAVMIGIASYIQTKGGTELSEREEIVAQGNLSL